MLGLLSVVSMEKKHLVSTVSLARIYALFI